MNTQTKKAAETGLVAADQIKTVFGDVNERAKTAMEKSAKIVEELAELTRGNVEAIVASSKVAAKGVETMSQDAAEYQPQELRGRLGGFQELRGSQVGDRFLQASGRLRPQRVRQRGRRERPRVSETVLKLAGDVAEPITSRYTVAAERVKTLAA